MAVRIAYSLGMHRREPLILYPVEEQDCRRRLWRTMFVLDRVLATSLGRPLVIAEEDCSSELLFPHTNTLQQCFHIVSDQTCSAGLEATVISTHLLGLVLRKVYLQRRVSTKEAQVLVNECKQYGLPPTFTWRHAAPTDLRQAMAILHSNLAYCQSIILLSRPFFLHILNLDIQRAQSGDEREAGQSPTWMEKCSQTCIIASTNTISLIQNAYEGHYLSKFDSSITYSLFTASLIIFANEFVRPWSNVLGSESIINAINIMSFCGDMDPQAKRLAKILTDFRNVIEKLEHPTLPHRPSMTSHVNSQGYPTYVNDRNSFVPTLDREFNPAAQLTDAASESSHASLFGSPARNPYASSTGDTFPGLLDLTHGLLSRLAEPSPEEDDEVIDFDEMWDQWSGSRPPPNNGTPHGGPGYVVNGMPMGAPPMGTTLH